MPPIRVTLDATKLSRDHWDALAERANANVFVHPTALEAVRATDFADICLLLAFDHTVEPERLVGLLVLEKRRIAPFLPAFLSAPPYDYAFLSTPVVDRNMTGEVVDALLEAIRREPSLPKVVRLKYLDGDSEACAALLRGLGAAGGKWLMLSERERPFASREAGLKPSGSTRKKLRQDWNRLSGVGTAEIVNDRSAPAVEQAFEAFLAIEAASWKGAQGTAILSKARDAAFARKFIRDLAREGNASVALLTLDKRPIAAQVLLYCGTTAYTWKTAFEAEFGKYSPGALLIERITEQLFAGGAIEEIESCSPEGGFMAHLWSGRRATVDVLLDLAPHRSTTFAAMAMAEHAYRRLKEWRNALRPGWRTPQLKLKELAAQFAAFLGLI